MSRVGQKYYGKVPAEVIGARDWDNHDATKTWSDGGAVREIVEAMVPKLEAALAHNVSLGVSEYLGDGEAAIRADQRTGELHVGLRLHNSEASLIVEIPLKRLMIAALTDMRNNIAVDRGAQDAVTSLVDLGRQLITIGGVGNHAASHTSAATPGPPQNPPASLSQLKTAKPPGKKQTLSSRKPATLSD